MDTKFTIDWLSVTLPKENLAHAVDRLDFGAVVGKPDADARHGYNRSQRHESGAVIMWHQSEDTPHGHIVLSGSTLRWLTENGSTPDFVLKTMKVLGGRASRIDMAIDIHGSRLRSVNFGEEFTLPIKGGGRKPKITPVGTDKQGWTVYVGSRSSEKFLRIYDKAKEMGDFESDYIRIELECKGSVAHWLGATLPDKTVMESYVLASSIIKTMVNFSSYQWSQALASNTVEWSVPKQTARDTFAWLIRSCAPALARMVAENPSRDILGEFAQALRDELGKRGVDAI